MTASSTFRGPTGDPSGLAAAAALVSGMGALNWPLLGRATGTLAVLTTWLLWIRWAGAGRRRGWREWVPPRWVPLLLVAAGGWTGFLLTPVRPLDLGPLLLGVSAVLLRLLATPVRLREDA